MPPNFKIELLIENIIVKLCISLKVNTSLRESHPIIQHFRIDLAFKQYENSKVFRVPKSR